MSKYENGLKAARATEKAYCNAKKKSYLKAGLVVGAVACVGLIGFLTKDYFLSSDDLKDIEESIRSVIGD